MAVARYLLTFLVAELWPFPDNFVLFLVAELWPVFQIALNQLQQREQQKTRFGGISYF